MVAGGMLRPASNDGLKRSQRATVDADPESPETTPDDE